MKFKIYKSEKVNWWLVAHINTSIVIEFEEKKYNETQKVKDLTSENKDIMLIAKVMREVGEWLAINHKNLI